MFGVDKVAGPAPNDLTNVAGGGCHGARRRLIVFQEGWVAHALANKNTRFRLDSRLRHGATG